MSGKQGNISKANLHIDSLNHVNGAFTFQHHGRGHPLLKADDKGLWCMRENVPIINI